MSLYLFLFGPVKKTGWSHLTKLPTTNQTKIPCMTNRGTQIKYSHSWEWINKTRISFPWGLNFMLLRSCVSERRGFAIIRNAWSCCWWSEEGLRFHLMRQNYCAFTSSCSLGHLMINAHSPAVLCSFLFALFYTNSKWQSIHVAELIIFFKINALMSKWI